ncbi:MAG: Heme A synthase, cytochrome oxidase biogenesis protein Cox15-CtaA [uncultured Microvirga sp.]|uniref:Heme A synthase n=1 Tax=uncultured Microvirga sp. TaxID=412392 RepID=A0A6J4MFJ0_9HYPH|nr:MAG: Heme A synthase, cytochrome oxidase biogenesis protein Cox15-CtaA [uncultured Microvirga sp.]
MTFAVTNEAIAPAHARPRRDARALLRAWLWALALLVIGMVAIGGATRLTGSGLSITEWKPVTGAIPPLSEAAWAVEFAKYQASPQYRLLNQGMTLDAFRTIYWWEWGHRQLGRFLGLFFFLPFLWFWAKGVFPRGLAAKLLLVGTLGGLQAAVGWIMVASGLEPGMTAVAPLKLMLHLTLASLIFTGLAWLATGLDAPARPISGSHRHRRAARILLGLILVQIALGGLVAGSKAGLTFNTWPLMDGRLAPPLDTLFAVTPWVENFVDNVALVQFNHRLTAYAVIALALWHAFAARGAENVGRRAAVLASLCLVQGALGVATLLLGVPLWAGLAHQLFAMAVLGTAAAHARLT